MPGPPLRVLLLTHVTTGTGGATLNDAPPDPKRVRSCRVIQEPRGLHRRRGWSCGIGARTPAWRESAEPGPGDRSRWPLAACPGTDRSAVPRPAGTPGARGEAGGPLEHGPPRGCLDQGERDDPEPGRPGRLRDVGGGRRHRLELGSPSGSLHGHAAACRRCHWTASRRQPSISRSRGPAGCGVLTTAGVHLVAANPAVGSNPQATSRCRIHSLAERCTRARPGATHADRSTESTGQEGTAPP